MNDDKTGNSPPVIPIDVTPDAAKVLTHWIDRHYATKQTQAENDHQEYKAELAIEEKNQARSFWVLVGVLIAIGTAAAYLYFTDAVGYAALILTHSLTFAAGWGTRIAIARSARGDEDE